MLVCLALCFGCICLAVLTPNLCQELSNGAVKMRLRRMCEVKKGTARCNVDNETHEQWKRGGAGREELEMALIQSLRNVGNVLDTRKVQERASLGSRLAAV